MPSLPANREARHVNFFKLKIGELRYNLEKVVDISDESKRFVMSGENGAEKHNVLIYTFSSFSNAIQSLKDSGSLFLPLHSLSWGKIGKLRHGEFMKESRNAITHDGNPIIDGWSDGSFYVGAKIARLDDKNRRVTIIPPIIGVREFCLEFAMDFAVLLSDVLKMVPADDKLMMATLSMEELCEAIKSPLVPEFAKELFARDYDGIEKIISTQRIPHVKNAIVAADSLAAYCKGRLKLPV